jgi:TatD DNase family protein
MIFDTHAHYDDKQFDEDRDSLLQNLKDFNIGTVVNVSSDLPSVEKTLHLADRYDFIYAAVGIHPENTDELNGETFAWLREQTNHPKVAAIGEIGLDYYWEKPEKKIQKTWFVRQLMLARECDLPFIIHSRDAAKDTIDILKAERAYEQNGVIHCFSYSREIAREYLDMGFYLGIGGVVTFSNAKKMKEVVEYVPLSQILLETDCPYLAPVPNRGKRNFSGNLKYVAEEIARLKNIPAETVISVTEENARNFYNL